MLLKLGFLFVMQAWTAVAASCCGSDLRKEIIDSGQACVLLRLGSFHIESEQSYLQERTGLFLSVFVKEIIDDELSPIRLTIGSCSIEFSTKTQKVLPQVCIDHQAGLCTVFALTVTN